MPLPAQSEFATPALESPDMFVLSRVLEVVGQYPRDRVPVDLVAVFEEAVCRELKCQPGDLLEWMDEKP